MNGTWATRFLRQMKSRPNVPFLVTTLVVILVIVSFMVIFLKLGAK